MSETYTADEAESWAAGIAAALAAKWATAAPGEPPPTLTNRREPETDDHIEHGPAPWREPGFTP